MIGFAECECIIYDASSLKEKRAVLKRIITRIRGRFNVSVSEIAYQDSWRRTSIGIAPFLPLAFKRKKSFSGF